MRKTFLFAATATAALSLAAVLSSCATPRPDANAAKPVATNCPPAPYQETLFLRGAMNDGTPREDYAFQWRCNAYFLNVDLAGEQKFRIVDAALGGGVAFGGPASAPTLLHTGEPFALSGGERAATGELKYAFAGAATIKLDFGDRAAGKPTITIGPKSFVDVDEKPIDDAIARSVKFDSRDPMYKFPFGAVKAGDEIQFGVSARAGVTNMTLVIEKRRLEGWQEALE